MRDYQLLKDNITITMGYSTMFHDSCGEMKELLIKQEKTDDAKEVGKYLKKAKFICGKFDELYLFFKKDYPEPKGIEEN